MNDKKLIRNLFLALLFLTIAAAATENYAAARTDLDWMLVSYKYQLGQGTAATETWEFSPRLTMDWWDAYIFTVARLILSAAAFGFMAAVIIAWGVKTSK